MQAVLYTDTMEPITVIDLPMSVHRMKFDTFFVPVYDPMPLNAMWNGTVHPEQCQARTVTIYIEKLHRKGVMYPMFFVHEEELLKAFALDSVPLVGQNRAFENHFKKGVLHGIMQCIDKL